MEARYVLDTQPPRLTPVESTALAGLGYDLGSRTLFVRFRTGALYAYLDVPPEVACAFGEASSKGAFFAERIDPAFRYVRLDGA